ncbi:glycoside hydrolase family 43 protein [Subtercola boreus]|uniref:glycoside hydrolase family 43 protein n=1 Tax=Subtercola boreus TaxID=120213 RepID=UPI001558C3E2|nr:glycoside hydrolase family 43 protein [Subtercola boreus]
MSETAYENPVVKGTAPDPSLIRVGNDFYLATSTFNFLPGVTLRHSTDLANWRIIGGAITRPSQYRRDGQPGGLMLFAPTLRYAEGTFYLICTNVADDQGNFLISTTNPAGEWSDAVWIDTDAFDPSLLYDDGVWYYTRRTLAPRADGKLGPVVQAEIDITTGALGELRELTPDYGGFVTNDIEGPHLYRIGEWYYLFSAEGGSWKGHLQSCARSRSPWGPFESAPHNPVLTHRNRVGHPIQSLGHAELVDAPDGSWWAVALGTRHLAHGGFVSHHNLGRETFLLPVEWVDGWPVIGNAGTTELVVRPGRALPSAAARTARESNSGGGISRAAHAFWRAGWNTVGVMPIGLTADGFSEQTGVDETVVDGTAARGPEVAPAGTGAPVAAFRSQTINSVSLPFGVDLAGDGATSALGAVFLPQREDAAVFEATLFEAPDARAAAGVAAYADENHYFSLLISASADGSRQARFARVVDDLSSETVVDIAPTGSITLRITASATNYAFSLCSHDAEGAPGDWTDLGSGIARLLSAETAETFVGVRFALLAVSGAEAGGAARFSAVTSTSYSFASFVSAGSSGIR